MGAVGGCDGRSFWRNRQLETVVHMIVSDEALEVIAPLLTTDQVYECYSARIFVDCLLPVLLALRRHRIAPTTLRTPPRR